MPSIRNTTRCRVLLTGGSGFIAAHILEILLQQGHSVVTTVRSLEKAEDIQRAHPGIPKSALDFAIVKDIAQEGVFDEVVKSDPPFEAVIHTASPYHYNTTDTRKNLLDPAILGTVGILKAIKSGAPSVKRVVITSSFVSVMSNKRGVVSDYTYTDKDWNPVTEEEALDSPQSGYQASKTFAERAAWEFVGEEKPNFSLTTICPPLVFGPVIHHRGPADTLNTSSSRIRNLMSGTAKEKIPDTGFYLWVDVRDLAMAHVRAMELPAAENKRFLVIAGYFNNKEVTQIVRENFPAYEDRLPTVDTPGGGYPAEPLYRFDSSPAETLLGVEFRSLRQSIKDLVASLEP